MKEARKFGKAIWEITGKGVNVDSVFEHPGEATFPVSCFVVKRGGMVVFCAGTTGYNLTMDARYRLDAPEAHPGLAFRQSAAGGPANKLVVERRIDPVHVGGVPLGADPAKRTCKMWKNEHARQHGGAGQRAAARACAPSRTCSRRASRCSGG